MEDVTTLSENEASTAPAKLDLTKYRSQELTEKLLDLLSVEDSVKGFLKTAFWIYLITAGILAIYLYFAEASKVSWFIVGGYAFVATAIFAVATGILKFVWNSLKNLEGILDLLISNSIIAVKDLANVTSGHATLPSGPELVSQMHVDVFSPILEQVVERQFGFLGKPIKWVYKKTVGSGVKFLIKKVSVWRTTDDEASKLQKQAWSGIEEYAKNHEELTKFLSKASHIVASAGSGLRFYAIRPLFFVLCVAAAIAVMPIVVYGIVVGF